MRMSKDEIQILKNVCKDFDLDPKLLRNIFITEENYYFSNNLSENAKLQEIMKEIMHWAEKGE